ncbi:hypothetical protein DPV73_02700 [Leptospira mayottensis]|nr:hypothetical protein DPV73_02700 [Leptospira mayottensis]
MSLHNRNNWKKIIAKPWKRKIYKFGRKRGSCIKSEEEKDSRQRKEICDLCYCKPSGLDLREMNWFKDSIYRCSGHVIRNRIYKK